MKNASRNPWLLAGLTGLALALPLSWYAFSRNSAPSTSSPSSEVQQIKVSSRITLEGHTADIYDLVLLKDGQTLVTASADNTVRFWNLGSGRLIRTLSSHTNVVKALAMTTDQEILITTGDDRTIRFWQMADGELLLALADAHPAPINALEVSNNGRLLISADSNGAIYLWDLGGQERISISAEPIQTLQADGTVNDLLFTRDDSYLVSGGKSLQVWAMDDRDQPITLEGHEPSSFINRLDISEDNRTLISASSDQTTRLWNLSDHSQEVVLRGAQSYVNDVRIDGSRLWSADANQTIEVWDLRQGVHISTITGFDTDIWRFAVQLNGDIVTIGGTEHNISIWTFTPVPSGRWLPLLRLLRSPTIPSEPPGPTRSGGRR